MHTDLDVELVSAQLSGPLFDFQPELVYLTKTEIILSPEMSTKQVCPVSASLP